MRRRGNARRHGSRRREAGPRTPLPRRFDGAGRRRDDRARHQPEPDRPALGGCRRVRPVAPVFEFIPTDGRSTRRPTYTVGLGPTARDADGAVDHGRPTRRSRTAAAPKIVRFRPLERRIGRGLDPEPVRPVHAADGSCDAPSSRGAATQGGKALIGLLQLGRERHGPRLRPDVRPRLRPEGRHRGRRRERRRRRASPSPLPAARPSRPPPGHEEQWVGSGRGRPRRDDRLEHLVGGRGVLPEVDELHPDRWNS